VRLVLDTNTVVSALLWHGPSPHRFALTGRCPCPDGSKGRCPTGFVARLTALRKQAGISQTALAKEIGISQRVMAYYEAPKAFAPATLLPGIAGALGVSVEALPGTQTAKRKVKPADTRIQRRLQQIANLPAEERRQIMQLVDAFIARGQLKRRATADN
jgi:transcriptional regulator with XRE-family HTH domain